MEAENTGCRSKSLARPPSIANRSNGLQFEWVAEALGRRFGWRLLHRHSRWGGVEADRLFQTPRGLVWIEARWRRTPVRFERTIDWRKRRRLARGAGALFRATGQPVRVGVLLGWGPLIPGRIGRWVLAWVPEWTRVRYRLVWLDS